MSDTWSSTIPTRNVTWAEFAVLIDRIEAAVRRRASVWDAIVAVARGGLVSATVLSHRLSCPNLGVIRYRRTTSDEPQLLSRGPGISSGFLLPSGEPRSILLVEDIVAYGTTAAFCYDFLSSAYPTASIFSVALFRDCNYPTDPTVIAEERFFAADIITNEKWVHFPWENKPPEG